MNRIWVKVTDPKIRVPIEGPRRAYFDPEKKHFVPNTPFIQRRLAEQDLMEVEPDPEPKEAAAPAAEVGKVVANGAKPTPAAEATTSQEH